MTFDSSCIRGRRSAVPAKALDVIANIKLGRFRKFHRMGLLQAVELVVPRL